MYIKVCPCKQIQELLLVLFGEPWRNFMFLFQPPEVLNKLMKMPVTIQVKTDNS